MTILFELIQNKIFFLNLFMEKIVKTESKLQVEQKRLIYLDTWFSKPSA